MDDVWKDISSLPSLHHPTTTHHFQDFLAPPAPRPGGGATFHHPPAPPVHEPLTTMLSLSTSGNSEHDQDPPHNTTSIIVVTSPHVQETSPPEYTEKFKRLMKNRESAARSRARKQARADELEEEVLRLTKENAKLRRLQKEFCSASTAHVPKKPRLHRSKSAPL